MAKSRLVGSYPVIGIRPTIDGRRGALDVRGSLEDQTMNMAKSAAKLFEENLKYSNGEPVKVVIADTTIGRVGESAACADKFRKEGVDITLTVTPCWCYGAETMDMDPQTIKAVWGFNGTERPGAVYLASVLATHAQKGLPAFGIYGHDVQEADDTSIPEDVKEKLLRFGRAAVAAASMRGKSYLQIGSVTMGIGGSIIDSDFIESYLGMRVESVDEVEIIRRMTEGIYDHAMVVIGYSVVISIVLSLFWPVVQTGINNFGIWIANSSETSPVLYARFRHCPYQTAACFARMGGGNDSDDPGGDPYGGGE